MDGTFFATKPMKSWFLYPRLAGHSADAEPEWCLAAILMEKRGGFISLGGLISKLRQPTN